MTGNYIFSNAHRYKKKYISDNLHIMQIFGISIILLFYRIPELVKNLVCNSWCTYNNCVMHPVFISAHTI